MPTERKNKPDEQIKALKAWMLVNDCKVAGLARMTGSNPRRLTDQLCGHDKTWPPRAAINAALGFDMFTRPPRAHVTRPAKPTPPQPADRMLRSEHVFTR